MTNSGSLAKERCSKWVLMCITFAIAVSTSLAQLPTATILGIVRDATGAVVLGASLTARNTDTGQTRNTVSGQDGGYRLEALPVGTYELKVEHPGFKSDVHSNLTLTVAQEAVVNVTLEVGSTEQLVTVTGEAPLVNTTISSLGGLVGTDPDCRFAPEWSQLSD